MQAYQIHQFGFDHLHLAKVPDAEPGPGEVLVEVRAVSLNFRDLLVLTGHYNPRLPMPTTPGSDGAGKVLAVGPGVTEFQVGDRVCNCFFENWTDGPLTPVAAKSALGAGGRGVLAEQVVLSARGLVPIPNEVSYADAATFPCAALTAWNALTCTGDIRDKSVVLIGTGGVSIFALQLATAMGARVLLVSRTEEKLARAKRLAPIETVCSSTQPEWADWVLERTDGLGADLVLEVGGAGTLPQSVKATRLAGTIALIGVLTGRGSFDPTGLIMKAIRLQGIFVGHRAMLQEMIAFIERQSIKPVIDSAYSFDHAIAAYQRLASGNQFGKIVIEVP